MRLVQLTKGKCALVDDEDFDRVNRFKWHCMQCRRNAPIYAGRTVRKNGKRTTEYMHKFILRNDTPATDHIDTNGLNNQKSNLRPCTRFQNGQNRKIQKHSSPYKGVTWFEPAKAYMVKICIRGKERFLGYVKDPAKGAMIYDEFAIKHFGRFARTNKQMEVSLAL